jgi:hypothetical protein
MCCTKYKTFDYPGAAYNDSETSKLTAPGGAAFWECSLGKNSVPQCSKRSHKKQRNLCGFCAMVYSGVRYHL